MPIVKRYTQVLVLALCASGVGSGQATNGDPSVSLLDRYTPQELAQEAAKLKEKAEKSQTGSASEVLQRYPGHFTMLGYRDRSGNAELHRNYADIDVVLDGSATLITGGVLVDARTTGEGEMLGSSIQGGRSAEIHQGDILHIPANTPHQMLIPAGGSLTYFVIKAFEPSDRH